MSTATATLHAPFAYSDTGHPADILEGARNVTRFLAEMAPYMPETTGGLGLSEQGAFGLQIILDCLDKTIAAAAAGL